MAENSQSVLNRIGEVLKNLFDGNGFEKNVINPSEEFLNNLTQETETTEKGLLASVKEFIDENVTSKIGNLKEKGLEGLEDLKDRIFEGPNLEELSQNFLDAKENGDTDQMARLSKQIVKINVMQEPQKYKEMSEEQMYNSRLSEGLAALDAETYKQTLSSEELENSDDILEAMKISSREKYLNNDFYTNEQILTNELINIANEGWNNGEYNGNYEKLTAIDYAIQEAEEKEKVVSEGHSNLKLFGMFEKISNDYKEQRNSSIEFYHEHGTWHISNAYTAMTGVNRAGEGYRENIENQDLTKAKKYMNNHVDIEYYTQVPEELFKQKEEQKVPWEGRNSNRY